MTIIVKEGKAIKIPTNYKFTSEDMNEKEEEIESYSQKEIDEYFAYNEQKLPVVDITVSFNTKELILHLEVEDTHFDDGDRSWRYGNGFTINFVQPLKNQERSAKFYAYGVSMIKGEPTCTLINHNGVYYLRKDEELIPNIEIDHEKGKGTYTLNIPWKKLYPFHPLLDKQLGINCTYISKIKGTENRYFLQTVFDQHYDSEAISAKKCHLLEFECQSPNLAMMTEKNLITKPIINTYLTYQSNKTSQTLLKFKITNDEGVDIIISENIIDVKEGINELKETASIVLEEASRLNIEVSIDGFEASQFCFYLPIVELNKMEHFVKNITIEEGDKTQEMIKATLEYHWEVLSEEIKAFDPREKPESIMQKYEKLVELIDQYKQDGNIFTKEGHIEAAFRSFDTKIQPFSFVFPPNFDPSKEYALMVALHGSGVNEIGIAKVYSKVMQKVNIITVAPRGRDLSDFYIGDTERDIVELIRIVKNIFSIGKTFIVGFSMGGYGVWRQCALHTELYDAGVIFSGALNPPWDKQEKETISALISEKLSLPPLYLVHGTIDDAIPFKPVDEFVKKMKERYDITYVPLEDKAHGNYDFLDLFEKITNWIQTKFQ